jgi:hypothetical protein
MTMDEGSLFAKPAGEWTDDELRVGAVQAARRRDELAAAGEAEQAEFLNDLCADLLDERDRRAALRREVEDAMVPSVDITDALEQDPPDRGRERRLSVATAEWRAGTARPVDTKVTCPRGDATSLGVFETSAGLLFAGKAPMPWPRTSNDQRQVEYAMLLDGADLGWVDTGCIRCDRRKHGERVFRLDLDAVRRAVLAGAKLYRAT